MTSRDVVVCEVIMSIGRSWIIDGRRKPGSALILTDAIVTNLFLCSLQ
jgi:hypothetical protein